jgi:hypothetical protein
MIAVGRIQKGSYIVERRLRRGCICVVSASTAMMPARYHQIA